jgi:hypothetical protein
MGLRWTRSGFDVVCKGADNRKQKREDDRGAKLDQSAT